jgi:hypothetical protein
MIKKRHIAAAAAAAVAAVATVIALAPGHYGAGVLPSSSLTPGVTNPNVTQANISSTICVSGWTATIRPPASYTTALKVKQLASGYALNGDTNTADYEEDHLISLELGGNPTDPNNLWPELYTTTPNAHDKDKTENYLKARVCAGNMTLAEAQHEISTDWVAVFSTLPKSHAFGSTAPDDQDDL